MSGTSTPTVIVEPTGPLQQPPVIQPRQPIDTSSVVQVKNGQGTTDYFLRLSVTGWSPRGFGPFKTEQDAVEFLARVLCDLEQSISEHRSNLRGSAYYHEIYDVQEHPVVLTYLRAVGHGT